MSRKNALYPRSTQEFPSAFIKDITMSTPESKIIIVGGGVFGLSTSLWLARAGYQDITIFDRGEFDKNNYNPADGCDGASADINKIFRMTYGEKKR